MKSGNNNKSSKNALDKESVGKLKQALQNQSISLTDLKNVQAVLQKISSAIIQSAVIFPSAKSKVVDDETGSLYDPVTASTLQQIQGIRQNAIALLNSNKYNCRTRRQRRIDIAAETENLKVPTTGKRRKMNKDEDEKTPYQMPIPINMKSGFNPFKEHCYICKETFLQKLPIRHDYYKAMCKFCGDFNFLKRNQRADLSGKIALVTGGRMKIGLEIVLKLLRCNCKLVIVTTRFPVDAAKTFSSFPDFIQWKERLHIYGLDMRFLGRVEEFCSFVKTKYQKLDILIQNAAQTIRKPAAYYGKLAALEIAEPKGEEWRDLIHIWRPQELMNKDMAKLSFLKNYSSHLPMVKEAIKESNPEPNAEAALAEINGLPDLAQNNRTKHSSQFLVHPEDFLYESDRFKFDQDFPSGRLDEDGLPLDLRRQNSWTLNLDAVNPVEMAEVMVVNYMAPYIILKNLTGMLRPETFNNRPTHKAFVIMVSAMEGKFHCFKTSRHPHTNAAKAALNMLVRSSGKYYYDMGVLLNAVDTGWVTEEHPQHIKSKDFKPPLDCVDGAARVLDPIMTALDGCGGKPIFGKFLKDYKVVDW